MRQSEIKTTGQLLREKRLSENKSLRDAARDLGLNPMRLAYLEQDDQEMQPQEIVFIATYLGISTEKLKAMIGLQKPVVEKRREERAKGLETTRKIFELISQVPGEDKGLFVDCPACGKKVWFVRSSYNGHIRAQCETPNCFAVIQ